MWTYAFRYLDAEGAFCGAAGFRDFEGDHDALATVIRDIPPDAMSIEIWSGDRLLSESRFGAVGRGQRARSHHPAAKNSCAYTNRLGIELDGYGGFLRKIRFREFLRAIWN
jgi:hypothetical protein